MKFYRCKHCGNIIAYAFSSGVDVICCGEEMQELVPGTVDASKEKHIPVITLNGNKVTINVGSVAHPMIDAHFIQWIALETKYGNQRHELKPNEEPSATFTINDNDEVVAAYAFCNLHMLWKSTL